MVAAATVRSRLSIRRKGAWARGPCISLAWRMICANARFEVTAGEPTDRGVAVDIEVA
jgi:hypothetical protein